LKKRADTDSGISEIQSLSKTFNEMAENLRQSDEAKKAFIADVTHELRTPLTVIKGTIETLEDGALDLPDDVLSECDLVVGAVHSKFNLPRARQTGRILAAMDHPFFSILAHPTGRLLEARPPYDVDMLAIVRKAKHRGLCLELNAHPDRLDLSDAHCRMAKDEGVPVAISSDAHAADGLDVLRYGVGQARRGWLERKDVLNTRPLAELRPLLKALHRPDRARVFG